ncbi:hypothetical protein M0813_02898 [Anaeramoeba flamelloides]|uniref:Uncharacterized protein n=1 Tax=Anaeramoeba flamelloides TaxID=1746091 RepID=A0ABQ8YEP7_9EUKA|nr:hypothetical protein M0813_02898 [Anaeramoeba flamelloides]
MKRIFEKKQTKTKDNTPQKPQKNRLRSFHSEPIYKKKQKQKQKTKKQKEKIKKSKALRTLFKGLLKKNKKEKEKEKEKENKKKVDGKKNEFVESTNPNSQPIQSTNKMNYELSVWPSMSSSKKKNQKPKTNTQKLKTKKQKKKKKKQIDEDLQKLQTIYELKPFIKESLNLNLSSEEHTIPKILDLQQIIAKTFVLFFSPVNLLSNKILKRQNLLSERLPDLAWETTVYQSEIDREVANYQERSDKVTSELKKLRTELGVVKKLLSNTVRRTSESLLLIQIANNSLDLCKNKRKHTHGDGIKNQKNCYCSYDNESQNMKNSIVWQFDELKQKSNNLRKKSLLAEIPNQRTDLLYYKWQQFEINRLDSFKELYKEITKNYSHQLISEIFEKIDSQNSINEIQIEKAEKNEK